MNRQMIFSLAAFFVMGCAGSHPSPKDSSSSDGPNSQAQAVAAASASLYTDPIMLFESWPSETTLDNPHITDVEEVWLNAIRSAQQTIDFSHYYAITAPNTTHEKVVNAIKEAGQRGVKIRFIVDTSMNRDDNAELPALLATFPNLELRFIDYRQVIGGVQHAKYFIVDGKTAYLGSQNFDWRSLEEIAEMGVRMTVPELVTPLIETFEIDWQLAADPTKIPQINQTNCPAPVAAAYHGETIEVIAALSPKGLIPCEDVLWDLPMILSLIDNATQSVDLQLMTYATENYDKTTFFDLDEALIRAAGRGVRVRLLFSDWSTRPKHIGDLQRLARIDSIEAKMVTIPEHSSGFVPFSRVIHSKFMVIDNNAAWIGTSNWSGDYFYTSRNVGIVVRGERFNRDLRQSFDHYWSSEYAHTVDPDATYPVKKRN
ncbi:MAG: phospholipase D-like domain-containing protein [Proteobacteria bacterium]|nr:phospholipase D-like domain-containing protein [Pseudomonadota bacterium]